VLRFLTVLYWEMIMFNSDEFKAAIVCTVAFVLGLLVAFS